MVIPFIEFEYGGWYPRGGIYGIAQAFYRRCLELGVKFHFETDVKSIQTDGRNAIGIVTDIDQVFEAKHVISNTDVFHAQNKLLSRNNVKRPDLSTSGFVMLMPMKSNPFSMAHHTVLFSDAYQEEFTTIFNAQAAPKEMTVYISVSSRTDETQSGNEKENWFVLVNTPPTSMEGEWTQERSAAYKEAVLSMIERFLPGMKSYIANEPQIISPDDFSREFHATGGSLYGSSSNSMFSAFLRPKNKDPRIRNLYHCGGSAHPGGGIPLVILSGHFAAREVINNS
jgi:phytoene desaturase